MIADIKTLKRKVDSISTNIKIYERDLEKHLKDLKSRGIEGSISSHIKQLKDENKKLIQQEQSLLRKADKILNRME